MDKKRAAPADAARGLALLWGPQTVPGRSGLTLKAIITAATDLADGGGLEALSMRAVADRLQAGTMSLYTHVPGKAELIDLMLDAAYGETYASVEEPSQQPGGWRGALTFIARRNWEVFLRHPWMLQNPNARPVLGPQVTLKYEAELRPLDGIGLDDVEMDAALTLVLGHVEGCARAQAALERTKHDSGQTDAEWWVAQEPLLNRFLDLTHFPVSARVGAAAGEAYQAASNPAHGLTFGLERILDGIGTLIEGKAGG